jgi:hypothetical protein
LTERENNFAEQFVQNLREAGVNRGEAADKSFIAGEMFEVRARAAVIADGEQKK